MSLADPLELRILDALVESLEGIQAGLVYHHTVKTVTTNLLLLASLSSQQCPALIIVPEREGSQRNYMMGSTVADTYSYLIEARVDAPGVLMGERMEAHLRLKRDIEFAVTSDQSLGGLAVETRTEMVQGPYPGIGNDPQVHWQQRVTVVGVHQVGEP